MNILKFVAVVFFMSVIGVAPASAAGPSYNLTIGTPTINGGLVTLRGTVSVKNFPGTPASYKIAIINWGDGTAQTEDIPLSSVVVSGKNFTASWTAPIHTYTTGGSHTVTAKLYHTVGGSDKQATKTFNTPVNRAPVLSGVPSSATAAEMSPYTFTATASDVDVPAQTLTFSLVGAPAGATIGASSGVFAWTPSEAQGPGIYTFSVKVSDGFLTTTSTSTVSVYEVNQAPVMSWPPSSYVYTTPELTLFLLSISATDSDNDSLTYSATGLPAGATLNATTGQLSWTPSEAQGPGDYSFTAIASDGVLSGTKTINIHVTEVNSAPFAPSVYMTQYMNATSTIVIQGVDADLPAQTLTYTVDRQPYHGTLSTVDFATSGTVYYRPFDDYMGVDNFYIRVSDGTADSVVSVQIQVGGYPVLSGVPQSISVVQGETVTFTATSTNPNGNPLYYGLSVGAPANASLATSTGVFTWTTAANQATGQYSFYLYVLDGPPNSGLSDYKNITITVTNDAPTLSNVPSSVTIPEGSEYTFMASAVDPSGDPVSYGLSLQAPGGARMYSDGVFSWTPGELQGPADYTFDITATDGGSTVAQTITIYVTEVDDAPIAENSFQLAFANATTSILLSATDPDNVAKPALEYSIDTAPTHGVLSAPATANSAGHSSVAYRPNDNYAGPDSFVVKVTDGVSDVYFTVTLEVGSTPILSGIPDSVTIPELSPYTFTAVSTNPNGHPLEYTLSMGARATAYINSTTGVFIWNPDATQGGTDYRAVISVSDGSFVAEKEFTIFVTDNAN